MNEYDEECLQVFLEKQLQLFQEEVANDTGGGRGIFIRLHGSDL